MASLITHAVAAVSLGTAFYEPKSAKGLFIAGAACSLLPDFDVLGFRLGIHYGDFWGHRGFTHSLVFGAILASFATFLALAKLPGSRDRAKCWSFLFLATISHGTLDAMTNGGLGVAFFSPFDTSRYFLPWRPIAVSPIGVTRFFSERGFAVLASEVVWIWIPAAVFASVAILMRNAAQGESYSGKLRE